VNYRLIIISAAFGLCLPLSAAPAQTPELRLLEVREVKNFPSSSAILYYSRRFFLVGDDARNVLILNRRYQKVDSVTLFESPQLRVSRSTKADLETGVIDAAKRRLVLFGSGSSAERAKAFDIRLVKRKKKFLVSPVDYNRLLNEIPASSQPVNIEGAAMIGKKLVLGNRRMNRRSKNLLFVADGIPQEGGEGLNIRTVDIVLPDTLTTLPGISELNYVPASDLLLITFSLEETNTPARDGRIGDSYLGWISGFSKKLLAETISVTGFLRLSLYDKRFQGQKIEGLCVENRTRKRLQLHFVSDNDDGTSRIFKTLLVLRR
jgi:hypothetical protein